MWLVVTSTCSYCGHRAAHERFRSIGGTWRRCGRCNYAWRGLGQSLAAVFARPLLGACARAPVIDRDFQPLSTLSAVTRAPRPAPAALQHHSSSQASGSDQGPTGAEDWLADVEARFAGEHHGTQSGSGANDPVAPISISRAAARRLDTTTTANATETYQTDALVDPDWDHWLACLEAGYERTDVEGTSNAAASPVDVARSELADIPTSGERRPGLDSWLDTVDGLSLGCRDAEVGRHGERPVEDSGPRSCVDRPDEPCAPVLLQSRRPAPIMPVVTAVARLGEMDATLRLVGEALTRGETAYQRLVSRWTPCRLEVDVARSSAVVPFVAKVAGPEQDAPVTRESHAHLQGGDPGSDGWFATR